MLWTAMTAAALGALAGAVTTAAGKDAAPARTRVIVILRNQYQALLGTDAAARSALIAKEQSRLVAAAEAGGATRVIRYSIINAFAATVSADAAASLRADPAVLTVEPDRFTPSRPMSLSSAPLVGGALSRAAAVAAGLCPANPRRPLLEPEALASMHAVEAQRTATGRGVTVAYIADGIDPNNPDFIRPGGRHVFVRYVDFSGNGANAPTGGVEAFGDAASIAAQGRKTYDLSTFNVAKYALPKHCTIRILGVAPGASLVGIKAGDAGFFTSAVVQGIDYAVNTAHANVLNESLGANQYPDSLSSDAIRLADDAAAQSGVVVTVSTGDSGVTGTIATPASDPNVISAAASTDFRTYLQTGYGAARFATARTWLNDNISALSSGGITQGGRVPDLAAPGEANWSLCDASRRFGECVNFKNQPSAFIPFGGTSESAPLTAGAAALVIEAYRESHHGASPAPALVKQFLTSTTTDLGVPAFEQGAGLVNVLAAVNAARAWGSGPHSHRRHGTLVVAASPQIDLAGSPGSSQPVQVTVTNAGATRVKVNAATREFVPIGRSTHKTIRLNDATDPTFPYQTGAPWAYRSVTFKVRRGTDRLVVSIAWQGTNNPSFVGPASNATEYDALVRLTLIDPHGAYVADSRPQGGTLSPNHSVVDVHNPVGGVWTAVLSTPAKAAHLTAAGKGFTGPVLFEARTEAARAVHNVTPGRFTLGPGASRSVTVNERIPRSGGDTTTALVLRAATGAASTVPIVLRSVLGPDGVFGGDITGGNARGGAPAQTFTWAFDVLPGQTNLNINVHYARFPCCIQEGIVEAPNGEVASVATNILGFSHGFSLVAPAVQNVVAHPQVGRWRYVLVITNPVLGDRLDQPFTGRVTFDTTVVTSTGLPNSAGTMLPHGVSHTATVNYTNTGATPQRVQIDPRRGPNPVDVVLKPILGTDRPTYTFPVTSLVPVYIVPPDTATLSTVSTAAVTHQIELQGSVGEPDLLGTIGTTSTATDAPAASSVGSGFWDALPSPIGPFGAATAPQAATITTTAHTLAFDADVSSSVGDPYNGPVAAPLIVNPGQTVAISVQVTPQETAGTVVQGVLNVVSAPAPTLGDTGDVLAALPYMFTVS